MTWDERQLRVGILDLVPADEREALRRQSPARTLFTFGHIWLGLILSFWAVWELQALAWPWQVVLSVPLVAYIATRQNAFAVQVHEASHGSLLPSKRANDIFCNVFGAYWVLNDVGSYWSVHRRHRSDLGKETDPDRPLYRLPEARGGGPRVWSVLLGDLLMLTSVQRILAYLRPAADGGQADGGADGAAAGGASAGAASGTAGGAGHMAGKLGAQLVLLALAVWAFGPLEGALKYGVYWVLPLFSLFPLIIRLRIVTEHFGSELHGEGPAPFISRTTVTNALEDYLIGSDMQIHFEHHLLPDVPHHQLMRLHDTLLERGYFERIGETREDVLSDGYLSFWRRRLLPLTRPGAPRGAGTSDVHAA